MTTLGLQAIEITSEKKTIRSWVHQISDNEDSFSQVSGNFEFDLVQNSACWLN